MVCDRAASTQYSILGPGRSMDASLSRCRGPGGGKIPPQLQTNKAMSQANLRTPEWADLCGRGQPDLVRPSGAAEQGGQTDQCSGSNEYIENVSSLHALCIPQPRPRCIDIDHTPDLKFVQDAGAPHKTPAAPEPGGLLLSPRECDIIWSLCGICFGLDPAHLRFV
jgi:hypothetical protein